MKYFKKLLVRAIMSLKTKHAILDPRDNSVTFDNTLLFDIRRRIKKDTPTKALILYEPALGRYGIVIAPKVNTEVALCNIQQNGNNIGFETLCPTVARIFYDYGLPADIPQIMKAKHIKIPGGEHFYILETIL